MKVKSWYTEGLRLADQGKHTEAIAFYDKELQTSPNHFEAWCAKGWSLFETNQNYDAKECYNRALEIKSNDIQTLINRGLVFFKLSENDKALQDFERVTTLQSNHFWGWQNRGIALFNLNRYKDAIRCFDVALELNSNESETWRMKGACMDSLGKYTEALQNIEKSISLNPKNAYSWNSKGLVLLNMNQYDKALESFNKAVSLNPQIDLFQQNIAKLHQKKNGNRSGPQTRTYVRDPYIPLWKGPLILLLEQHPGIVMVFFSIFLPGISHFALGQRKKGIIYFLVPCFILVIYSYILAVVSFLNGPKEPVVVVTILVILAYDIYVAVKAYNLTNDLYPDGW